MSIYKKILFFAPFGTFTVHHQLDAVLSLAVRLRGHEAFGVLCDGIFPVCDVLAWSGQRASADCANCACSGKSLFNSFSLPTLQMREYFSTEEFVEIQQWADALNPEEYFKARWSDAPIGEWIISSVCSFFRITSHQLHQPVVREAHKKFLINGALTYLSLNRIIEQQGPSNAVVFNGRLAVYRVALEAFRRLSIPVITHERGWAQDTFVSFSNSMAIETKPIYECAEAWSDIPLQATEIDRVRSYFINREKGVDVNLTPFLTFQTEHSKVRAQARIPPETPIIALFTTGEYELEFCDDFKTDISQLDLIRALIDIFRDRPEALVIRHHPYIAGDETSPPDKDFLRQAALLALDAPDNVRVIMPGERLSSYALMWNATAVIAPFSMTGVESVSRGVKTFGLYQSPFRPGLSGILKDLTRAGIEASLEELLDSQAKFGVEDLRRLYRFQSSFISRLCTTYRSFGIRDNFGHDIKVTDLNQLRPGMDPALDRLCDHIAHGTPLFELPDSERRGVGIHEETLLLTEELERIQIKRQEVKDQAAAYFDNFGRPNVLLIRESSCDGQGNTWRKCLNRSRHQILDYRLAQYDKLDSILSLVVQTSAEICVLAPAQVLWLDEAFISRGCEELADDPNLNAVIAGQWYINKDRFDASKGQISHGLFTRHYRHQDAATVRKNIGEHGTWLSIVMSGVFRKARLIDLISSVLNKHSDDERFDLAMQFIHESDVKLLKEGLIYCQSAVGHRNSLL